VSEEGRPAPGYVDAPGDAEETEGNGTDGEDLPAKERPRSWEGLVGRDVVIDTDSSFVYIGRLEDVEDHFLALSTVDVHDMGDSRVTKEMYVLEAMKYGVRANRRFVYVARSRVLSVSLLDDVVRY
jgi:hypothetical protein